MHDGNAIKYKIDYSRRRTLSIIVSPCKGVVVKAPFRTSIGTIERFVREKEGWIERSLEKFRSLKRIDNSGISPDGGTTMLMGKEYLLRILPTDKYGVRIIQDQIIEVGVNGNTHPYIARAVLEKWLITTAKKIISSRFREILSKYSNYGFLPSGLTVRTMRSRWGSCSSKGMISLSSDLIKLDEKFTEYVIIHELCHLKHHNHGNGFYKLLSEIYPDWKNVRNGLKEFLR